MDWLRTKGVLQSILLVLTVLGLFGAAIVVLVQGFRAIDMSQHRLELDLKDSNHESERWRDRHLWKHHRLPPGVVPERE